MTIVQIRMDSGQVGIIIHNGTKVVPLYCDGCIHPTQTIKSQHAGACGFTGMFVVMVLELSGRLHCQTLIMWHTELLLFSVLHNSIVHRAQPLRLM